MTGAMILSVAAVQSLLVGRSEANGAHDVHGNPLTGLAPQEIAVTASGSLGDRPASITYWSERSDAEKASLEPPYSPPANWKYNTSSGPMPGMINVHLVPHSHDDVGWQVTVDQYFYEEVYYIVDTVTQNLAENPDRKFIEVETGFFARWWDEANEFKRERARTLARNGQLEFINGGWCMHDEASPTWDEMVDQTTRGHQFLLQHLNATPRGTWQVDPFGHTNTQAWLLGYEAGMPSLYFGRMDWQDRDMRFDATRAPLKGFEWIWQGSNSLPHAKVFGGELFGSGSGGYSTWFNFDSTSPQVVDDPQLQDYNVDEWVDKLVQDAMEQYSRSLTEHQMWACGTDFNFQNAAHWYTNLDKLIHYGNLNGSVNFFYSTPTIYTDWKLRNENVEYEVRTDDIMPLADDAHDYWTGYFASRPALKYQVRTATNLLQAGRLLEVVANTTLEDVMVLAGEADVSPHPAPRLGRSWTDGLEGAVGLATHHDGMSGTERQDVTDDYSMRISEQAVLAEVGIAASVAKLTGANALGLAQCNCDGVGACLNASICAATAEAKSTLTVAAWNSLAQPRTEVLMVPVVSSSWSCAFGDEALPTQILPLDDRTKSLPLMYLNSYNMTPAEVKAAEAELANEADAILAVEVSLPAVGLATFECATAGRPLQGVDNHEKPAAEQERERERAVVVSNEHYELEFDPTTNLLSRVTNLASGVSANLAVTWGWYNSSVGGTTDYPADIDPATASPAYSSQKSGAYIFRPNSSEVFGFETSDVTLEVVEGDLVTQVTQRFSSWASHVFRLYENANYVEVEFTAGPIPVDTPWFEPVAYDDNGTALPNNWGKEVILKYASSLATNDTYYTDSNGREMVKRVKNKRGPSYPDPYNISEPVAGNFYPITQLASIDDGDVELAVVVDRSVGGASLASGELEFMVHRRIQDDDSRGVEEPLNETMCGCNDINAAPGEMGEYGREGDGGCECTGLAIRGKHWLVLDRIQDSRAARRQLVERLNFPPVLVFDSDNRAALPSSLNVSAIQAALPPNVKLATITSNYAAWHDGAWLLRLAHLYEVGEHPTLAQPVDVDLTAVFATAGLKITAAYETTLTANQPKPGSTFEFPTATVRPMEVKTFLAHFE
ncbi:hypothetical protein CTAYLR_008233 [Chrysophaeum taylorii]|uniref:Alpha-mannosidase n=1 Tax=Chrysophaeum taylorii TaxID=2483200 RepID=A0AAD7UIZ2_9STRA|nr:hypothetical protein CTAYLR_008233 [Chrysophaeum taylorii]